MPEALGAERLDRRVEPELLVREAEPAHGLENLVDDRAALLQVERDKLAAMLGEQEAMVIEVKPFGLHGVTYYDVTVEFTDRTVEQARLGPEGVPDGLRPGERVLVTRAANMVISIRRP
jgi:hypothetical protein